MSLSPPPPPSDPVAALAACHVKIRAFLDGLARVCALPDLSDPRVPAAAAQAHRYFSQGLPLHAEDEDLSLAPRLLRVAPEAAPLLADLARDHRAADACLATLLPLLADLAAGKRVPHALLRAATDALAANLLPHLAREEAELFPLVAHLSEDDRLAFGRELADRRR